MAKRILIVDDEPDICEILRFNLEMEGYDVFVAEGAEEGQTVLENCLKNSSRQQSLGVQMGPSAGPGAHGQSVDLILLDVMMTPKSGFEWAQELKSDARTTDIPIIFCTAKTMEEDLLRGFALGSDDYICKPFRISEVKARVKAVMRRTALHYASERVEEAVSPIEDHAETALSGAPAQEARKVCFEGLHLDLDRKECYVDGVEVAFTKLEFELLALLLSKPGQVFSREKILHEVWPSDAIVLDRTVDVNITRIRKKIGRYGECLRTKFGYGYMFSDARK